VAARISIRPPSLIVFSEPALRLVIDDVGAHGNARERGGILLGHRRGRHFEVLEATVPMKWDRGTFFSFRRSARGHQTVALKRWKRSGGIIDWVGEWHSHPEPIPTPSSIDTDSWKRITRDRDAPMIFLIIGYSGQWLGLCMPGETAPIRYREAERSDAGIGFVPG
jgi:integrative and conjugative element protein (TIGR02256 family)